MRLTQRWMAWFNALEPARRSRLVAAVVVAIVAAIGLSVWATRTAYSPVVSGRGYDAALTAASAVDRAGIEYRIVAPDTLEVATVDLGKARAAIASETEMPGLAEVGDLQLGLTPQAQQWAFLRAAEGDLARMLNGIDGIVASKVHVVPRAEALYIGEERPASASVFVKMAPGAHLEQSKVRAIVNLVANAVDGLSPDRVSVADDRGNLLASGDGGDGDDSALGAVRSLVEYRTHLEGRYERAVSQALLPVLGWGGGFSATASVELDLESRETTTRQMEPSKQAVVSEVNEEQASTTTSGGGAGGVPGVDANLPERAAPNGGGKGGASNRTTSTLNYAYPTVDEVSKRPAGGVRRLSVAVQVDDARIAQLVEASGGKLDADALRKQIDAAVRAAVGYDETRKDQVIVSYLPFAQTDWTEGTEPGTDPLQLVGLVVPYLVGLGALGLVFWFVVRPLVGSVTAAPAAEGELVAEPLPALRGPAPGEIESGTDMAQRLRALVDNYQPVDQGELNHLVLNEAEIAADVLRKWARR
ncbi:MAG: flagellar basal-body MS-ring/collar protein FliF [Myxococcota bacterium]